MEIFNPMATHSKAGDGRGYGTDKVVEELGRLAETDSSAAIEILERMFASNAPNFDMDGNINKLLKKLYDMGHQTEVLRCVGMLRKTLPGMLEFYKSLG